MLQKPETTKETAGLKAVARLMRNLADPRTWKRIAKETFGGKYPWKECYQTYLNSCGGGGTEHVAKKERREDLAKKKVDKRDEEKVREEEADEDLFGKEVGKNAQAKRMRQVERECKQQKELAEKRKNWGNENRFKEVNNENGKRERDSDEEKEEEDAENEGDDEKEGDEEDVETDRDQEKEKEDETSAAPIEGGEENHPPQPVTSQFSTIVCEDVQMGVPEDKQESPKQNRGEFLAPPPPVFGSSLEFDRFHPSVPAPVTACALGEHRPKSKLGIFKTGKAKTLKAAFPPRYIRRPSTKKLPGASAVCPRAVPNAAQRDAENHREALKDAEARRKAEQEEELKNKQRKGKKNPFSRQHSDDEEKPDVLGGLVMQQDEQKRKEREQEERREQRRRMRQEQRDEQERLGMLQEEAGEESEEEEEEEEED
uniref:Uncharacterized protein n=1 Tax=Chromera velia CCMP2878 TaxID=1169474 RepID=A0A0G4I8V0_9ALVE|eukprot:Cvel_11989.t1-p1 / transcript=Cvel_11989.t1 / gene=Cvel_11989 / organism=Chromera_velia_CCMP2878 / gene_product=hypothetical protein / transcript_product=hypothetical protein / location=Cvel_scaffold769:16525-20740(-) / protein_length=427 / sequence_SO=supercontig / SO=protein_coding / is_pseudo=false